MNFNSLNFIVAFLPMTLLAFYLATPRARLFVIATCSLIFYAASGLFVLFAFIVAILWTFFSVRILDRTRSSKILAILIPISVPLFFLVMFKYLDFALDTVQAGEKTRDYFFFFSSILLPAGISFYTFELISYTMDVADGKIEPERDLLRFTSFATFFPHLIAGPIMRYEPLRDQLQRLRTAPHLAPNIISGLKFFAVGLIFKIFAADLCGNLVNIAQEMPKDKLSAVDQVMQVGLWSMQIYYDFWAYSIMAIGLGRLFCIELPVNFREPYLSRNPREFWQRWHISLSYWLRDYVYIRMGGREAYLRNILIVFALVGLWHGAGWNFVAWGAYHGLLVILYQRTSSYWDRLPGGVAVALTFVLVSLVWPLFFLSLADYAEFWTHLASAPWDETAYKPLHFLYLAGLGVITFRAVERDLLYSEAGLFSRWLNAPVIVSGLLFAGMLFLSISRTFIYFRF